MKRIIVTIISCLLCISCEPNITDGEKTKSTQNTTIKPAIPTLEPASKDFVPQHGTYITHNLQYDETEAYPMKKKSNCFMVLQRDCERIDAFETELNQYQPEIYQHELGYMIWFKTKTTIKDFTYLVDQYFTDYAVYPCYEKTMMHFARYENGQPIPIKGEFFFVDGTVHLTMNKPILETEPWLQIELMQFCQVTAQPVADGEYIIVISPKAQDKLFEIANDYNKKFSDYLKAEVGMILKYKEH